MTADPASPRKAARSAASRPLPLTVLCVPARCAGASGDAAAPRPVQAPEAAPQAAAASARGAGCRLPPRQPRAPLDGSRNRQGVRRRRRHRAGRRHQRLGRRSPQLCRRARAARAGGAGQGSGAAQPGRSACCSPTAWCCRKRRRRSGISSPMSRRSSTGCARARWSSSICNRCRRRRRASRARTICRRSMTPIAPPS